MNNMIGNSYVPLNWKVSDMLQDRSIIIGIPKDRKTLLIKKINGEICEIFYTNKIINVNVK